MHHLSHIHDPLSRLILTVIVSALSAVFNRPARLVDPDTYHWITPVTPDEPIDIFDTHPRIRKVG
jgi:hypothetical protein